MSGFLQRLLDNGARSVGEVRSPSGIPVAANTPAVDPLEQVVEVSPPVDATSRLSPPGLHHTQLEESPAKTVDRVPRHDDAFEPPARPGSLPFLRDAGFRPPEPIAPGPVPLTSSGNTSTITRASTIPPETRERWREMRTRLLVGHPPSSTDSAREVQGVDADRTASTGAPAIVRPAAPASRAADPQGTDSPAPSVGPQAAATPASPARSVSTVASRIGAPRDSSTDDVVIQQLDVRVVSGDSRVRPVAPSGDHPQQRGGAWTVAGRRYLGRV